MLWKEEVQKFYDENKNYKDVELSHMLADNCAMQLVRNPKQFDVIVTDNLFGDMLSDEAAMLTGSLGMLPSASLSEKDKMEELGQCMNLVTALLLILLVKELRKPACNDPKFCNGS